METIIDLLKNPSNSWVLYGIAFCLMLVALAIRSSNSHKLTIKGDNSGIAVNGDVNGNVTQSNITTNINTNNERKTEGPTTISKIIGLVSSLSGILSLAIAAATFYLTQISPS